MAKQNEKTEPLPDRLTIEMPLKLEEELTPLDPLDQILEVIGKLIRRDPSVNGALLNSLVATLTPLDSAERLRFMRDMETLRRCGESAYSAALQQSVVLQHKETSL